MCECETKEGSEIRYGRISIIKAGRMEGGHLPNQLKEVAKRGGQATPLLDSAPVDNY